MRAEDFQVLRFRQDGVLYTPIFRGQAMLGPEPAARLAETADPTRPPARKFACLLLDEGPIQGGDGPEEQLPGFDLCSAEGGDVVADELGCGNVAFDEGRADGAAAKRFQAERSGAGEEVDGMRAFDVRPDEVEDRFAHAVFHRPRPQIAGILDRPPAPTAADDPQLRRQRFVRRFSGVPFGHETSGRLRPSY